MKTVGGARRGLGLWLAQRASAVVMALYLPAFLAYAWASGPLDYPGWRALFAPLASKVAGLLFVAALLLHAWVGLREICIDYVHPLALRLPLLFLFALAYLGCLAWAADILWSVPA
ncbi:succinate dehydrogenase, hydrophobic membrane anchor protein [Parasulfuritortus cantonensis]|uniref:succinate dehydrogenase, hydrophobic membrane anchor protein n=1 Tax=Parasulfuritortus cantonensis TaxID=2528202 RepID=UPI00140491B3|nr:succinate dehydrogenase, hydrophobic membrane anchor protein [Parasulfuritortus cantonensis]